MLHGTYGEQHKTYHRCQGQYHQPVCPGVLQTKQVGEANRHYPTEDQNSPKHSWEALSCRLALMSSIRVHPAGVSSTCTIKGACPCSIRGHSLSTTSSA